MDEVVADQHATAVIVALDVTSEKNALQLVSVLGSHATHYKIGIQTLTAAGPSFVKRLVADEKRVFLDLKLHEIPTSVAGAIRAAGTLGASMVTVHASAGSSVLSAAVVAASSFPDLRVLAVTVITSLADTDLVEIGLRPPVANQVERLADLASNCGCHGVIASPLEAALLRLRLPQGSLIVCPGIQLIDQEGASGGHARAATPEQAAASGATHIVIGRPIATAPDPLAALLDAERRFRRGCLTRVAG